MLAAVLLVPFGEAEASQRGYPVSRVIAYGDSMWEGCLACASLTAAGWTIRNAGKGGATVWSWPTGNCISPFPNNDGCIGVIDRMIEQSPGVCAVEIDMGAGVEPTCLTSLKRPGDIVVVQAGTNDVFRTWATVFDADVKPAWNAVLDHVESFGLSLVIIYPIPIMQSQTTEIPYTTLNTRLRELRDWLHTAIESRTNTIVEVDLYQLWTQYEQTHGETAFLELYKDCTTKGQLVGDGDCVHYEVPVDCPNSVGDCAPTLASEAIKNGILHARRLAANQGDLDWCARLSVRPDSRVADSGTCLMETPKQTVAERADIMVYGDFDDVLASQNPKLEATCKGASSHEANFTFASDVRALRDGLRRPLRVGHMMRWDLVGTRTAALPGFDPAFLVRKDAGAPTASAFFAADVSSHCTGGTACSWDFDRWETGSTINNLAETIEALEPGASDDVVYYLPRHPTNSVVFGPIAALADLGNASYRAWRIGIVQQHLAAGQYDVVNLNHKFGQYYTPGFWMGGARRTTATDYVAAKDSAWSAEPDGYGYVEYIAGWQALADDLVAAGIPYYARMEPNPWLTSADDAGSPADETALILDGFQQADIALLDLSNISGDTPDGWEALVDNQGARVLRLDVRCGFAAGVQY